jgi:hypothetical protein
MLRNWMRSNRDWITRTFGRSVNRLRNVSHISVLGLMSQSSIGRAMYRPFQGRSAKWQNDTVHGAPANDSTIHNRRRRALPRDRFGRVVILQDYAVGGQLDRECFPC